MFMAKIRQTILEPASASSTAAVQAAVRTVTEIVSQMQRRRSAKAARADIERLLANDPHLLRDIGLFDTTCKRNDGSLAAPWSRGSASDGADRRVEALS
jgi:hypothetical protein